MTEPYTPPLGLRPDDVTYFVDGARSLHSDLEGGQILAHVRVIASLVRNYTRGGGFDEDGVPNDDVRGVILLCVSRLLSNPSQTDMEQADNWSARGGFKGFTLTELLILNAYRRRAC